VKAMKVSFIIRLIRLWSWAM